MPTETALSCERAKRCEWCAKGVLLDWGVHLIPLPKPSQWMWQEPPYERHTCAAPAIEYLYEELAKERDELKSRVKSLQQYAQHEPACDRESDSPGGKICTCGMWDALNPDWREISAAQEKNNA